MSDSEDKRKKWIVAASELAKDLGAKVKCPDCGQAFLSSQDEQVDASHIDRRIFCAACGRQEWILINTVLRNIQ